MIFGWMGWPKEFVNQLIASERKLPSMYLQRVTEQKPISPQTDSLEVALEKGCLRSKVAWILAENQDVVYTQFHSALQAIELMIGTGKRISR